MTLVATDKSKDTLKMYKELWDRTKNIIRLITNNSDIYDENYMKIKFRWLFTSKESSKENF